MIDKNRFEMVDGKLEQVAGTIKKTVGRIIGDETLETKGKAEEQEGTDRREAARTDERIKGAVEIVAGTAKDKIGHLVGDEKMEKEGKHQAEKGEARQEANK